MDRPTLLPRLHLFELIDQPWLPSVVRRLGTDYLHTIIHLARAFDPAAPIVARAVAASPDRRIVDLCSGGSGPVLGLVEGGRVDASITMTDIFPDPVAFARIAARSEGRVDYVDAPVDARDVPASLRGARTLFDGLHHFRPDEARAILADAAAKGVPIVVAEGMHRSARGLLSALFIPLLVLLLTPLVRPRTWWRFALTYLVPIAPIVITFDGLVSCLRTYRPAELLEMTRGLGGAGYTWEAGEIAHRGGRITWLLGLPAPRKDA